MIAATVIPDLVAAQLRDRSTAATECEVCKRALYFTWAEVDDFQNTALLVSHRYCLDCLVWLIGMESS